MSDLNPEDRALLDDARESHEPTERDRARVRLALLLQLGVGTGLAGTTAATSKAATLGVLAKVLTAVAIAGAIGATGVVAYRAARPASAPVAAAAAAGISERGATSPAPASPPPMMPALDAPESTQETVERFVPSEPSVPKSATPRTPQRATARSAVPVAAAASPDSPGPALSDTVDTPVAPTTESGPLTVPPSVAPASQPLLPPTTLEAETRLIRAGVTALHGGDPARALALFDEHLRAFPNGALAEERAGERVIALGDLRRCDEARAAAATFLRDYPHSPLAARVREPCNRAPNP